jgi:hypothetical protein
VAVLRRSLSSVQADHQEALQMAAVAAAQEQQAMLDSQEQVRGISGLWLIGPYLVAVVSQLFIWHI